MGQEPVLDPSDSRFMTVDINGQRIGMGGVWVSLARALGNTVKTATSPDDRGQLLNLDVLDPENGNPLVRFWRGKAAPGPGLIWDIAMHEDYQGNPVISVQDVLKQAGTRMLPISLEGFILQEGRSFQSTLTGGLATASGLRTFPEPRREVLDDVSKDLFQGKPYSDLSPVQRAQVQEDERLKALPVPKGERYETERKVQALQTTYRTELERLAGQVERREITPNQFRIAATEARAMRAAGFGELPQEPKRGPQGETDIAADRYFAMLRQKDEYGRVNFDAAESFLAGLPKHSQDHIKQIERAGLERLGPQAKGLMTELTEARERLRPYWEKREEQLRKRGLWAEWQEATPAERVQLERTPKYKMAERLWDRQRQVLRWRDRQIDADLQRWYGLTGIRQQGR